MSKVKSIRNENIKSEYHYGLGNVLARKHGISRQRIHQIMKLPTEASPDEKISPFRKFYEGFIKKLFNKGG